jgi:hypothetical protein
MKRTLKPIFPPAGIEKEYEKRLKKAVREMEHSVIYWLSARYKANESKILDSATDDMTKAFRKLLHQWDSNFRELSETLPHWFVEKTKAYVHNNLIEQTKPLRDAGLGFNLKFSYMSQKERQTFQAIVKENVNLIKSIASENLTQVEGVVLRSIQNGHDLATMTENLHKQFGVTERRAAMIARDQTNKATENLSRERLKSYGITKGIWMHTASGKTYRETHILDHTEGGMNGAEYFLDEGCYDNDPNVQDYIHPAELVNCYCVCRPLIPEVSEEETLEGIDEILGVEDYQTQIDELNGEIKQANSDGDISLEEKLTDELYDLKYDAARDGVVFTSGLDPKLDSVDAEIIRQKLSKAPEDIRIVWNKLESEMNIISGTSKLQYYSPSQNGIYLNLQLNKNPDYNIPSFQTLFHENAHFINSNIKPGQVFSHVFENGIFAKTIKEEATEYVNSVYKAMQKERGSFVYKVAAYKNVENELYSIPINKSLTISDLFNGATKGKIRDGWVHPTKYGTDSNLSNEAFAEMMAASIANPDDLGYIKQYFPKSYKVFLRMIKTMAKRR